MHPRREFLTGLAAAAGIPALAPAIAAAAELVEQRGGALPALDPDPETIDFWRGFLQNTATPAAAVPTGATRGVKGDRECFFFYSTGGDGAEVRPAVDIPASKLHTDGDVTVSVNVSVFKPATQDKAMFERLQSAQLRLDLLQNISIVDLVDTMAWTAIALLRPDSQKKLPPLQSLSFDPGTSWKKMQNIVLPRGQGRWALNLYAQRADGFFTRVLQVLNKEVGRFAPVFGLPGISTIALQSFNEFYGAFHSKPEYLLRGVPVGVFGTASALKQGAPSRGLPLCTGNYVIVPTEHAHELTNDVLSTLELKQGYLVPKKTEPVNVTRAAVDRLPNVTYATLDVVVKPVSLPCAAK